MIDKSQVPTTKNAPTYNEFDDTPWYLRPFRAPVDFEGFYSPFWPLLIVFVAYTALLVYEIAVLRYRGLVLERQEHRLAEVVQKAQAQDAFVEGIHQDLKTLAPSHPAAANLLKDFFPDAPVDPAASSPDAPAK